MLQGAELTTVVTTAIEEQGRADCTEPEMDGLTQRLVTVDAMHGNRALLRTARERRSGRHARSRVGTVRPRRVAAGASDMAPSARINSRTMKTNRRGARRRQWELGMGHAQNMDYNRSRTTQH
jgi:hypothetical protein